LPSTCQLEAVESRIMKAVDAEAFLSRPVYQVNEAARLLRLPDKTLRRWLDGDWKHGEYTPPLLRNEQTESWDVTWGEFIGAGLLGQYRDPKLPPIERLRPLIQALAEEFETAYPLAIAKPLFSDGGRWQLFQLQSRFEVAEGLELVRQLVDVGNRLDEGYQLVLTPVAERFVSRVEFDAEGIAKRWYPAAPDRRIVQDPAIAFGLPSIKGVRTETVAELRAAKQSSSAIVQTYAFYGLTTADVRLAVEFEEQLVAAA
jgi:uncharacterized protein (DUF433 family)